MKKRSIDMRLINNVALAALAALLAHPRSAPCAVTVTASREYVVRQTTLHPVTNNGEVVGYALGPQTDKVIASREYVDSVSTKDGYATTNDLHVAVTNLEDKIEKATPDNYEAVSSAALSAVQPAQLDAAVSNLEEQIEGASSGVTSNDVKLSEVRLPYGYWTLTPLPELSEPDYLFVLEHRYGVHDPPEKWSYWASYSTNGYAGSFLILSSVSRQFSVTFKFGDVMYTATPSGPEVYMLGSQGERLIQPAGRYASLDAVNALEHMVDRKQDALPYPTNAIPYSAISGAPVPPAGSMTNRYPLFVIDLNPGETRFWNHIELKATTNNYASSHANMLYFMGTTTNGTNTDDVVFVHDWCRLFILSKRADSDIRKWVRIRNTGDLNGYAPLALAIIVDPSMFRRNQGSEWLYEDNEELIWSYVRIGLENAETDQDGRPCWRPVMPVKWYWRLPKWADERESPVDSSNVTPYVPPWNE